jgi:hypothetical protein
MNIKALKNNFVIKEVPIPHLKRCGGGLSASKLLTNPKQILEIYRFIFSQINEERIVSKLKKLEERLKNTFKNIQ